MYDVIRTFHFYPFLTASSEREFHQQNMQKSKLSILSDSHPALLHTDECHYSTDFLTFFLALQISVNTNAVRHSDFQQLCHQVYTYA